MKSLTLTIFRRSKMKYHATYLMCLMFLFSSFNLFAQEEAIDAYHAKFSGYLKHRHSLEGIEGVNIFVESIQKGTTTNGEGYFEMVLPKGLFRIKFSKVGLQEEILTFDLIDHQIIELNMKESIVNLSEVTILSEEPDANLKSLDLGKSVLDRKKLINMPSFLGEADVVKMMLLLPGVSTIGEGASGFNVRGGSVDQNLILQDGAPIFNPSHVFGFFSAFNPASVNSSTLYKGTIPAQYGGRIASVLAVTVKDGDFNDFGFDGSIGTVSSKVAISGPIVEQKLSFLVSGRTSYSDGILKYFDGYENGSAKFNDTNFKLSYLLNEKNRISYSFYFSDDAFAFDLDTTYHWNTTNHVFNGTHIFGENLVLHSRFFTGKYSYNVEDEQGINSFRVNSDIDYSGANATFDYILNNHNLSFGGNSTYYKFQPGEQNPLTSDSEIEYKKIPNEKSLETALFLEDQFDLNSRLTLKAGLRFNYFITLGSGSDFVYNPLAPKNTANIIDTVFYDNNEIISAYNGLNPRISLNYKINASNSIKASYNSTQQFLHLITNTTSVTPTDIWKTSDRYIRPSSGDQYSLGIYKNLKDNTYEASIEGYYKESEDIVDFKNGAALFLNENIEADLIQGISKAYGLEFFLKKRTGRLSGWLGYTYSRSLRKMTGSFNDEIISNGDWFSSNYDKPHDFTMTLDYKPNKVFQIGANFTYSTGRPVTNPLTTYDLTNVTSIFLFSKRNEGRVPDYHRLDISMTFRNTPKHGRKSRHSIVFAIYNLYGRKNAYSVFYENQFGAPPKAYKFSVLGSMFPSLTFNYQLTGNN